MALKITLDSLENNTKQISPLDLSDYREERFSQGHVYIHSGIELISNVIENGAGGAGKNRQLCIKPVRESNLGCDVHKSDELTGITAVI